MNEAVVVDYAASFPNAVAAQGKGTNVLVLTHLAKPYPGRADRKPASYELEHRWLSQPCQASNDEVYVCVQGSELTYWQRKELPAALLAGLKTGTVNLFDHFNLF